MLKLWFHIYRTNTQQPLLFKLTQTSASEHHLFLFFNGKYQCEVSKHSERSSARLSWALSVQSSFSFSTLNKLTTDKLFNLFPWATVQVLVTHSSLWAMGRCLLHLPGSCTWGQVSTEPTQVCFWSGSGYETEAGASAADAWGKLGEALAVRNSPTAHTLRQCKDEFHKRL